MEALPELMSPFKGVALLNQQSRNGRRYVLIESIEPGSTVARAGLRVGDVILSINRRAVGTIDDIRAVVERADAELLLLVQRGRATRYFQLPKR